MSLFKVLSSNVFRRSVLASLGFVGMALVTVWIGVAVVLWQLERDAWADLDQLAADFGEIYEEDGFDVLLDEIWEEDLIWEEDVLYARLEEADPILVLWDGDEVVAGYPSFWAEEEPLVVVLDHPEIEDPVRALAAELDDDLWIGVGLFVSEQEYFVDWLRDVMALALVLVGLPLSLVIGFFLSRGVLSRIEGLSDTARHVTAGAMDRRAVLRGTGDEFDRLAGQINTMLDQLVQLNRNIEAVSVGVAHDLKTPLANIGGRLELIRRDLSDPDAATAHISAAEGYLEGLLRTFDALLRLGEVEAGRRRGSFAELSLSAIAEDLVSAYAPLFDDAGKTLTVDLAAGVGLDGDGALLEQMLSNLLENALEHSRDGARVFVSLTVVEGNAILRVGDDGPGISPVDRERLFERFYRSDRSRGSRGNGLGLSLVKAIAELHSATVTVEDGAPGAVFVVRFNSYKTV